MISKSIIDACLATGKVENKDIVIRELVNHFSQQYDYKDMKSNHVLEMVVDKTAVITLDKINIEHVINNPELLMCNHDKVNIKNISITYIDNIEGTVEFEFDYKYKDDENNENIAYIHSGVNISYIDNPEILKKY